MKDDLRLNELSPSLFPLGALHPVLVEFCDLFIWLLIQLGEIPHSVLKDLVVQPGYFEVNITLQDGWRDNIASSLC